MRGMDGIGWAASAMSAARARLDVAAENLANGSTGAFHRTLLRDVLGSAGVSMLQARDESQGALRRTGRPFDLAIVGKGTFRVQAPGGKLQESRDGAFRRDRFDRLVDAQGRFLLGSAGPVRVPNRAKIERDGVIDLDGVFLNRIPLPRGTTLRTGFLESSNVDAIGEMVDMLSAERSFETAQKVLTTIDQTRERAASQVGTLK